MLDGKEDILKLPRGKEYPDSDTLRFVPDFEECVKMGIDAIELKNERNFHYILYGWDCECILVLNKEKIILL